MVIIIMQAAIHLDIGHSSALQIMLNCISMQNYDLEYCAQLPMQLCNLGTFDFVMAKVD